MGRAILTLIRSFHYWHKNHLNVALALVVLGGISYLLAQLGLSASFTHLPLNLEHVLSLLTAVFFGLYLVLISAGKAAAVFWPPPVVPLITPVPRPALRPRGDHWIFQDAGGFEYRFRYAREIDLPTFGRLAMADPAILMTYSYLSVSEWHAVYRRWYDLQEKNLMVLERRDDDATPWSIVGVSIVVPLSRRGAQLLWTGGIGTADIGSEHVSAPGRRPSVLLLDLLAADRHALAKAPEMIFALSKAHLAHHWDPWPGRKMEIWIEAIHRALPKVLEEAGFEGPHRTARHHVFYRLVLPLRGVHFNARQKETAARLLSGIHECAAWRLQ